MPNQKILTTHPRLLNQLFENPDFKIDRESLGYLVRDIINMNWWNTAGILRGYTKNRRVNGEFTETQKLIAVQLKEFYRQRRIILKDEAAFRQEIKNYIDKKGMALRQLGMFSMRARANPSQFFHKNVKAENGQNQLVMTWVDCTSRAIYAAKYILQNGYIDFDGVCRLDGCKKVVEFIEKGICEDLGVKELFIEGESLAKKECFSQEKYQMTVTEWVEHLDIKPIAERKWLLNEIGHVRTDPFKNYEAFLLKFDRLPGVNELLYGFKTSASVDTIGASHASDASAASHASSASRASNASAASHASNASNASAASDAGNTGFTGTAWSECKTAIKKPTRLDTPKNRKNFRANSECEVGKEKGTFVRRA